MPKFQLLSNFALHRILTMKKSIFTAIIIVFVNLNNVLSHDRPPMVAPGHYDNVQNPNFQQPPAVGIPQQPAQGFGGPPAAQYAQTHQQQPPVQAHVPHPDQPGMVQEQKVLHSNIQHEKQHIAEHMDIPMDTSKMSEQELQFHYFKMHDNDNNNKLDGTELIKSLIHWHETGHDSPQAEHAQQPPPPKLFTDEELIGLIDPILGMDDVNKDGYIDYTEFVRAQQKAANNAN